MLIWPAKIYFRLVLAVCVLILLAQSPAAVLGAEPSDPAGPEPLFIAATEQSNSDASELIPTTVGTAKRKRLVKVDFDQLHSQQPVSLNLFDNATFTAIHQLARPAYGEDISWEGVLEGIPTSRVILVYREDSLSGLVTLPGTSYLIRPVDDDLHAIVELEPEAVPSFDQDTVSINLSPTGELDTAIAASNDGASIDLLLLYSPSAEPFLESNFGDLDQFASVLQTTLCSTFDGSQINASARVVHHQQVNYDETGVDPYELMTDMRLTGDGVLDEIHPLRDEYGADAVILFLEWGKTAGEGTGMGYQMQTNDPAFESAAFAAVGADSIATNVLLSAMHELGHIMGASHDRDAGCDGVYDYSCGHVVKNNFRTIMAYPKSYETSLSWFSNPNLFWQNQPVGITGLADNARSLNRTAATVASFRPSVMHSITGRVIDLNGDPLGGATIAISPGNEMVQTCDAQGYFQVPVKSGETYSLTPSCSAESCRDLEFSPASRQVTVDDGDISDLDFLGWSGATVSGRVKDEAGNTLSNVSVNGLPGDYLAATDAKGDYTLLVDARYHHSVDVMPFKTGYWFKPVALDFQFEWDETYGNQNFEGQLIELQNWPELGKPGSYVGVTANKLPPSATVRLTINDQPLTTLCTDTQGGLDFQFHTHPLAPNGDYQVDLELTNPYACHHSILGRVVDTSGHALEQAVVTAQNGAITTVSSANNNGFYFLEGLEPGAYQISVEQDETTFSPALHNVTLPPSVIGLDFSATGRSLAQTDAAHLEMDQIDGYPYPSISFRFTLDPQAPLWQQGSGTVIEIPVDLGPQGGNLFLPIIARQ